MTFKPSPEQIEAIEADTDKLCIVACAGSGKTAMLTRRIARLVGEGKADPHHVAAITFTVLAADRLKWELRMLLRSGKLSSKIFVGTIHSFCANILREFQPPTAEEVRILSEGQQFVLLDRFWNEWDIARLAPNRPKGMLLRCLAETINLAKMERIPDERLKDNNPIFHEILISYNYFLRENTFFDFADLLLQVLDKLRADEEFASGVIDRYHWLFVDEYQDVDDVQAEIISIITGSYGNALCVVGDDDQSIYNFRGTDVRIILRFSREKNVTTKYLSVNRRCPKNVLSISENCITRVQERLPKQMSSLIPTGKVVCQQFKKLEQETAYVVETIRQYMSSGICKSYGDIAILLRSVASYGSHYIEALRAADIPYVSRGDRGLFDRPEVDSIVATCEWIAKAEHTVEYMTLLQDVLGLNPPEEWEIESDDIFDLSREDFLSMGMTDEIYAIFQSLLDIRENYHSGRFGSLLELTLQIIDALQLCHNASGAEMFNIASLTQIVFDFDEIRQTRHITQLCAYFTMYASHSFDEAMPIETDLEAVKVLTVHQAKGLEFDHVFVPMLVDKRFPVMERGKAWLIGRELFPSERYLSTEEAERRLFYVACTRARRSLHLLSSQGVGIRTLKTPSEFFLEANNVALPEKNNFPKKKPRSAGGGVSYLVASYSALEYYLTCPYRYKLIKIYGLATPVNPFFEFGRIIHAVLHVFHQDLLNGNRMSEEEVTALYEKVFRIRYNVPKFVLEKRKRAGLKGIKRYLREKNEWQSSISATETDFELLRSQCLLRGRIDLVLGNKATGAKIIDFKTGKPQEYLRTDFQMQVYTLAAMDEMDLEINQASLYYIEYGEEVTFDVNTKFINEAESTLMGVIDGILSHKFYPSPGSVCTRCEVRRFCPEHSN